MNSKKILFQGSILLFFLVLSLQLIFALVENGNYVGSLNVGDNGDNVIITGPGQQLQHYCGNGYFEPTTNNEQCDGNEGLVACSSLPGYSGYTGTVGCTSGCTYSYTNCQLPTNNESGNGGSNGGGGGGGGSNNGFSNLGTTDCAENWECSDWGTCSSKIQTRTCTDLSGCKTNDLKPSIERSCTVDGARGEAGIGLTNQNSSTSNSGFFGGITGAVIGGLSSPRVYIPLIFVILVAGAAIFVVARRKNKAPTMNN